MRLAAFRRHLYYGTGTQVVTASVDHHAMSIPTPELSYLATRLVKYLAGMG